MKTRFIFSFLLLVVLSNTILLAQRPIEHQHLQNSYNANALALSHVLTALPSNEPMSIFYNPAQIGSFTNQTQFVGSSSLFSFSPEDYTTRLNGAFVFGWKPSEESPLGLGISYYSNRYSYEKDSFESNPKPDGSASLTKDPHGRSHAFAIGASYQTIKGIKIQAGFTYKTSVDDQLQLNYTRLNNELYSYAIAESNKQDLTDFGYQVHFTISNWVPKTWLQLKNANEQSFSIILGYAKRNMGFTNNPDSWIYLPLQSTSTLALAFNYSIFSAEKTLLTASFSMESEKEGTELFGSSEVYSDLILLKRLSTAIRVELLETISVSSGYNTKAPNLYSESIGFELAFKGMMQLINPKLSKSNIFYRLEPRFSFASAIPINADLNQIYVNSIQFRYIFM